jgi:hypothetical protein
MDAKATTQLHPSFPSPLAKEVGGWVERKLNLACLELNNDSGVMGCATPKTKLSYRVKCHIGDFHTPNSKERKEGDPNGFYTSSVHAGLLLRNNPLYVPGRCV